eukprot:3363589-Rhodomonas_salina.7
MVGPVSEGVHRQPRGRARAVGASFAGSRGRHHPVLRPLRAERAWRRHHCDQPRAALPHGPHTLQVPSPISRRTLAATDLAHVMCVVQQSPAGASEEGESICGWGRCGPRAREGAAEGVHEAPLQEPLSRLLSVPPVPGPPQPARPVSGTIHPLLLRLGRAARGSDRDCADRR